MPNVIRQPVPRDSSAIQASSASGSTMSLASSNTPGTAADPPGRRGPAGDRERPMPISSSGDAVVPAASSPSLARWMTVRVVEKPTAPAAIASRRRAAMAAISSAVASALAPPRSPIT
jgi:hypothetical protein